MSNVSKTNSQMATKWANQRREMIERAKKNKEESKYGLALNGEMALASDVTTGYSKRNSHTPMTPMSAMDEPGPRRTYMNERPVTHEEMNQAKDSLRLLKSKMRNGSRKSLGLNDSKGSRGGNQYESEDETYKPNKIHSYQNISDNEPSSRRQTSGLGGPPSGNQGNYRKVFHPGAKRDSEDEYERKDRGFDQQFGGKNDDFGRRNDRTDRNQGNSKQQSSRTRGDPFQQEENKMASKPAPKPPLANTRKGTTGGRNDDFNNDPWGQPEEYKPDPPQNKRPPPKQAKSGYEPSNSEYDSKPPARPAPSRNTPMNRNNKEKEPPAPIPVKFEEDDDRPAFTGKAINFAKVQAQDEYAEYDNEPKYECPEGCGRKFVESALERHVNICKKVFQTKRKAFDSKAMRVDNEEQEKLMMQGASRDIQQGKSEAMKKKTASNFPANKKAKWKQQSEAFRANMKAARGVEVSAAEQQVLQAAADEGLIRCDCCGRKFNEKAAQRHIPFCQQKTKMDSIKQAPGAKKPTMPPSNNNTYSKSRR